MSLEIQTIPFDGIDQKDAVLNQDQMGRVFTIGSSWTTLRIGMRYALTDAGSSLGTGPELWFGLLASPSADMANGPLTATTSHFVGVRLLNSWIRTTGPERYLSNVEFAKRVTSTNTPVPVGTSLSGAQPETIKQALVFQMQKSGTNPVLECVNLNGSTSLVAGRVPYSTLVSAMNSADMTAVESVLEGGTAGYTLDDTNSLSVDEGADGALNAVCVAWNSGVAQLHVSEVLFRVIA